MANQNLFLGTCGWSYKNDWRDLFYPKELKPSQFLEFYSEIFNSVEIDSSFYRIPSKKYVKNWVETTSTNFYFSAKLPREITHKSYLNITMSNRYLKEYFLNISPIENQNRMIGHLVQLPPSFTFKKHLNNLESFLKIWKKLKKTLGTKIIKNMKNS